MNTRPNYLCVFDCDGTMVDSQYGIILAMTAAFRHHALPEPDAEAVRRVVGLPLVEAVGRLAPHVEPDEHGAVAESYKTAFAKTRDDGRLSESLYPGVAATLAELDDTGWLLGVATGKSRRGLDLTLAHHGLADRFITVQTADSARGKPDPDMLDKAMAAAGASPQTTVMVGDTTYDMEMAMNAGVLGVGVSWGYHPVADLRAAGAHIIIDACAALPAVISDLLQPEFHHENRR